MSTKAKRSPQEVRASIVRAEKPHCGELGEPFIYRMIGLPSICSRIVSIISINNNTFIKIK